MVDPVNPANPVPNITQSARPSQKERDIKEGDKTISAPLDRVSVSKEAVNLSEAQNLSVLIGNQVSNDPSITLSGDKARLRALT